MKTIDKKTLRFREDPLKNHGISTRKGVRGRGAKRRRNTQKRRGREWGSLFSSDNNSAGYAAEWGGGGSVKGGKLFQKRVKKEELRGIGRHGGVEKD